MFEGEKVFYGSRPIKYVFYPSSDSQYLVVVFSGFPGPGKPPVYNYVKTLEEIECNKLFILDDHNNTHSSGATYYLGINGDHSVEMSVVALITKLANEQGISHRNIICAGSSKGGFASLYFGIKYSFGHVISGAAQIFLGEYLAYQPQEIKYIISFITGSLEEGRKYLNNLMFNVVKTALNPPEIFIHVGRGDHHYQGHIVPLTNVLDEANIMYNLEILDYQEHSQLSEFFPDSLKKRLQYILSKKTNNPYSSSI